MKLYVPENDLEPAADPLLMDAVLQGDPAKVRERLAAGAAVDGRDATGSTGLIGRRSAASSRCAISARLDSSLWAGRDGNGGAAAMRFGSGAGGIWNTGSNGGGAGGAWATGSKEGGTGGG